MPLKSIKRIKYWYEYHERRISMGSLGVGFIVDSLTLQRVDNLFDNLWIASNIFLAGACIVLLNRHKSDDEPGFWLPNILQFSFGALLGSIFVFYLRSTTLSVTWPFLALLLLAILANEFFQKRYARLTLQLSFFYFSVFSFAIFLMPVLLNRIGVWVFFLSSIVGLVFIWLFLKMLGALARERFLEERTHIWGFVLVICLAINFLYFTNLIPPIPLSLKDADIYYQVEKTESGEYLLSGEERGVERYFTLFPEVFWQSGQALHAYTAVFAPGTLSTDIFHEWQYRDDKGRWVTATRIPLHLSGGRERGFRTFSSKYNFTPGLWRVDVKTPRGQIIGRINFRVSLRP